MTDLFIWLGIVAAFMGFEFYALHNPNDRIRPFTYWVRSLLHSEDHRNKRAWLSIIYWLIAALLLWTSIHFLVENVFVG